MQAVAFEAIQGLSGRLALLFLLHSFWIGLAVASLVTVAFQVCSHLSHEAAYRTLVVALLFAAVAPAAVTGLHRALAYQPTLTTAKQAMITVRSGEPVIDEQRPPAALSRNPANKAPRRPAELLSTAAVFASSAVAAIHWLQPLLLGAWFVGTSTFAGLLAVGARAVDRMCREAQPVPDAIRRRAAVLARRAKLKVPPRIMVHRRLREPCLCGFLRPVILLPDAWLTGCDDQLLDAMLAHEMAHALRLDHLVNLAQRLIETALFFCPAIHWLSRSVRRQREFCADSLAVRLTRDPLALAAALESIARLRLTSHARPVLGPALGGQNVSLLPRIQELLGMKPSRQRPRLWPLGALPVAGLLALIATASGLSQDQPGAQKDQAEAGQIRNTGRPVPRTKPASEFAANLDAPPAPADQPKSKREINYHIQSFDLTTDALHELYRDSTRLLIKENGVTAWIVDDVKVGGLIGQLRRPSARSLGCSEVSTSDAAPLTIRTYPAPQQPLKNPMIGHYLHVTGSIQADKIRLAADFRFLSPEEIAGPQGGKLMVDGPLRPENREIPTQQHHRLSFEIKDGGTLAVAFKPDWRDGRDLEPVVGKKSEAKADIKARPTANERLLLITAKSEFPDETGPDPAIIGSFDHKPR
jgi:beta-lactamase regulating signal transducer with metallopeptidase domain